MDAVLANEQVVEATLRRMTWDEWFAWAPESRITEWVDGEVIEAMPISNKHDAIARWLIAIFQFFLRKNPVGEIRMAPSVLKFSTLRRGREPDLMFVATANAHRLHPTFVQGPADALFEIVSPESRVRDYETKLAEYETEGVPEYWLLDPEIQHLRLYRLGDDGLYHIIEPADGKLASTVISGFYLRPEWLWQHPLPSELDILREFGVL